MSRHASQLQTARAAGDPFADLHQQMNRLFDDFLGGAAMPALPSSMSLPRMDVRENNQEICISADLPGVRPADVDVRLDGNMLTLRGEKHQESESQQPHDYHLMERSWGRFHRSLQLPFAPQPEDIHADFEHGVLTIHIPKHAQQARSQRIEVHAKDQPMQSRAVGHANQDGGAGGENAKKGGGSTGHH
jgi:HSP20 family protein